jgi:hypothetical protein
MAANPSDVTNPMAPEDPNQIICLKEKMTGSMLPTLVCHSRRDWIAQGVAARNLINRAQNARNTPLGGP